MIVTNANTISTGLCTKMCNLMYATIISNFIHIYIYIYTSQVGEIFVFGGISPENNLEL